MTLTQQIAKQFRDVYLGGNWTSSNLKQHLSNVTWQQAITKVNTFNTIAALVYHMNYYVVAVTKVLQGGPLDASDKYSFDHPPVASQEDWNNLLQKAFADAENFATLIEQFPDSKLLDPFVDGKYGNTFRNITGVCEHIHYHLGQIVLIKKMITQV